MSSIGDFASGNMPNSMMGFFPLSFDFGLSGNVLSGETDIQGQGFPGVTGSFADLLGNLVAQAETSPDNATQEMAMIIPDTAMATDAQEKSEYLEDAITIPINELRNEALVDGERKDASPQADASDRLVSLLPGTLVLLQDVVTPIPLGNTSSKTSGIDTQPITVIPSGVDPSFVQKGGQKGLLPSIQEDTFEQHLQTTAEAKIGKETFDAREPSHPDAQSMPAARVFDAKPQLFLSGIPTLETSPSQLGTEGPVATSPASASRSLTISDLPQDALPADAPSQVFEPEADSSFSRQFVSKSPSVQNKAAQNQADVLMRLTMKQSSTSQALDHVFQGHDQRVVLADEQLANPALAAGSPVDTSAQQKLAASALESAANQFKNLENPRNSDLLSVESLQQEPEWTASPRSSRFDQATAGRSLVDLAAETGSHAEKPQAQVFSARHATYTLLQTPPLALEGAQEIAAKQPTNANSLKDDLKAEDIDSAASLSDVSSALSSITVEGPSGAGTHQGLAGLSGAKNDPDNAHQLAANALTQLEDGISSGIQAGQKSLMMQLRPEGLGEVRLRISSTKPFEVDARLVVTSPEVQQAVQEQLNGLKERLESQGVKLNHLSVVVAGSGNGNAVTGNATSQRGDNQPGNPSAFQHQTPHQGLSQRQSASDANNAMTSSSLWQEGASNASSSGSQQQMSQQLQQQLAQQLSQQGGFSNGHRHVPEAALPSSPQSPQGIEEMSATDNRHLANGHANGNVDIRV